MTMEPPSKKQRIATLPESIQQLPGELRNSINQAVLALKLPEPQNRTYLTLNAEGQVLEEVQSLRRITVKTNAGTALFDIPVGHMAGLKEEFLGMAMAQVMHRVETPDELNRLVEMYRTRDPDGTCAYALNVEVRLTEVVAGGDFNRWRLCDKEHGADVEAYRYVEEWLQAMQELPLAANIFLMFDAIWRDYRNLWGLFRKYGMHKRAKIPCYFIDTVQFRQADLHKQLTLSAVNNTLLAAWDDLNDMQRAEWVKYGCRGFNNRERPTPTNITADNQPHA